MMGSSELSWLNMSKRADGGFSAIQLRSVKTLVSESQEIGTNRHHLHHTCIITANITHGMA